MSKIKFSDIPQFPTSKHRETVAFAQIPAWIAGQRRDALAGGYEFDLSPPYQRDFVWTLDQKRLYIEFLLRGGRNGLDIRFNMPGYVATYPGADVAVRMELVDGKQRVNAAQEFLDDKFSVFDGNFASDFEHQRFPVNFTFHVMELAPAEVVNFYISFNSGGTLHTADDMKKAFDVLRGIEARSPIVDTTFEQRRKRKEARKDAEIHGEVIDLCRHLN